MANFWNNA